MYKSSVPKSSRPVSEKHPKRKERLTMTHGFARSDKEEEDPTCLLEMTVWG